MVGSRTRGRCEQGETLANPTWCRLTANSDNDYSFELFPTEEVRTLIETGDWRTEEEFVIEVCLDPDFEEQGETLVGIAAETQPEARAALAQREP